MEQNGAAKGDGSDGTTGLLTGIIWHQGFVLVGTMMLSESVGDSIETLHFLPLVSSCIFATGWGSYGNHAGPHDHHKGACVPPRYFCQGTCA